MPNKGKMNVEISFQPKKADLNIIETDLSKIIALAKQPGQEMNKNLQSASQTAQKLRDILNNSFNKDLGTVNIKKFNQELTKSKLTANDVKKAFSEAGANGVMSFNKLSSIIVGTNVKLKESNKLLDSMAKTMTNTVKWGVSAAVFDTITKSIRTAYDYSVDLNKSLNDIRIVTGQSSEQMANFAKEANDAAKQLSANTLDYTNAALIYYQQGLSDEEAKRRAEITTKVVNVTGESGAQASENLTAIWNGYKVTAQEAEEYIDKVAKVAAASAADLDELATGMSKVAAAANSAGIDVDQLNALLATVISTTREAPETIGSSFRTIFARLGDLQLDGTDEYGVSLGKVSSQMEALGIEILDQQGQMRDMGDIIEDTAAKWNTWTQAQRQAAAIAMAGKMQYSRLIALFDNWSQYESYLDDSKNALGELDKEQSIYVESTNAKLNKLKATWQDLYDTLIDDDEVGTGIDLIRNLVQTIENFFSSFGGGLKSVAAFGALFSNVFNQQISKALISASSNLDTYQQNIDIIKNKLEYLNANVFTSARNEKPQDLAWQAGFEKQLEYANKIQEVKNGITQEDYNNLVNLQNQAAELQVQATYVEELRRLKAEELGLNIENEQEIENYTNHLQDISDDYSNITNDLNIQLDVVKELLKNTVSLSESEEEREDTLIEIQDAVKYIQDFSNQDFLNQKQKQTLLEKSKALEKETSQTLKDKQVKETDIVKLKNRVKQITTEINDIEKQGKSNVENKLQALGEIRLAYDDQAEKLEQVKLKENEINTILENAGKKANITENVTKATTAISSAVIGWSSLNSLMQTLEDDTISLQDKITQVAMTGVSGVSMLASGFKKLNDTMGYSSTLGEIFSAKQTLANTALKYGTDLSDANSIAIFKNQLMTKALITAKEKEVIANDRTLESLSKEEVAKVAKIGLDAEEAAAIEGVTFAQEKLNLAFYHNPVFILIAALTGLIGVLSLVKKHQDELTQSQIENNNVTIENANKKIEENEKLKENQKQYKELYNQYKETGKAGSEFLELSKSLSEQLDIENGWLLLQQGKYDELAEAIENATKKKSQFASLELAEGAEAAALDNLQKSFVKTSQSFVRNMEDDFGNMSYETTGLGIDSNRFFKGNVSNYGSQLVKDLISKNISSSYITDNGDLGLKVEDIEDPKKVADFTLEVVKLRDELQKSYKDLTDDDKSFYEKINKWVSSNNEAIESYKKQAEVLLDNKIEQKINNIKFDDNDLKNLDNFNKKYQELFNYIAEQKGYDLTSLSKEQIEEVGKITQEQIRAISDTANEAMSKKISVDDLVENQGWDKELAERYADALSQKTESSQRAEEIGILLNDIKEENKLTEEQGNLIAKLKQEYKDFADIQNFASHEYLETLREIQEQEEENKKAAIQQEKEILEIRKQAQEEAIKDLQEQYEKSKSIVEKENIQAKIDLETEELNKTIDDILNTDYSLKLEIDADLASDVDQAFGLADEIANLKDLFTENLQITFDQAQDLISRGFGEILTNAEPTADNLIQLNQDVVNSFIDGKQSEIEADRQSKISQLETQRELLVAQQNALGKKLESLNTALDASTAADAAEALSAAQTYDQEYQSKVTELNEKLGKEAEAATETENINEKLYNDLGGFYEKNSTNVQKAESISTTQQAQEIAKKKSNVKSLYNSYVNLARQVQASSTGGVVGWGAGEGGLLRGGGTISPSSTKVQAKQISASPITKESLIDQGLFTKDDKPTNEYRKTIQSLIDKTKNQQQNIENQIGAIDAGIAALETTGRSLDEYQARAGRGSGSGGGGRGGKGSGGGSQKDPEQIDLLDKERDIYHDVDIVLKQISTDLDKLQTQEKKLLGKDLIENLNKQLSLLNRQIDTTKQKIGIAQSEAAALQRSLSGYGVAFNNDETIANYAAAYEAQLNYVNGIIAQYNTMSAEEQEGFKDTVEQAKKDFDNFTQQISDYDKLITDTIPGLEKDIQSAIDKEIEIKISKFNMEIEIRLDMSEAERDWNKFKKEVIDDIQEDDILGNAKAELQDFFSYYKEEEAGIIQVNTQHVRDIIDQLESIRKTGTSTIYGDNEAQALEDLQTYYKQLMSDLTDVDELVEEIKSKYLDMMDEAKDKFGEQVDLYETLADMIDHDMKVIQLVYGEDSYNQLGQYYQQQEDNYNKQLDFQKQQISFWKQQMDILEEGSKEWDAAKENWLDAVEQWEDAVESAIENLQDKYLNAINEIFQNLNNKVTQGLGLDYVGEQWDLINKNADQYLDSVNATYNIQKLEEKYLKSIAESNNVAAQKALNESMEQEIGILRERDKLTQYDIDRAELKYQIALKQLALQEAQQNKSSMRLKRDSQGNYSYQFIADQEAVSSAQQEISDLYNQLYNLDVGQYQNNLDQLYDVWSDFQEKMKEAAQINDPEQREQRELLLKQEYGELINGIVQQNEDIRNNLYESSFLELSDLYDVSVENFSNMVEEDKELLMEGLVPYWNSGIQEMANVFAGEDGFLGVCREAFEELQNTTKDYEEGLNELQNAADEDFSSIAKGIDENIDFTRGLLQENEELITSYDHELKAIQDIIKELDILTEKYMRAKEEAIAATKAAYGYWQRQQEENADAARNGTEGQSNTGDTNNAPVETVTIGTADSGDTGSEQGDGNLEVGDVATYSGSYYYDSYGTSPAGSKYSDVTDGIVIDKINNNPYGIHIHSADGLYGDLGWIKRQQLTGFDTGGYTGDWSGEMGRLALLHQKELVLNKQDTKNILDVVTVARNITAAIGNSTLARLAEIGSNISSWQDMNNGTLEQNVHIEASFPNVKDSHEIEDALNNLVNIASMRANRKR